MDGVSSVNAPIELQQYLLRSQIQVSVLAKQLAAQRQQGDAAVALLESAVALSQEIGKGGALDAQA